MKNLFAEFARRVADDAGHPAAFILALTLVAVWAVTGPLFNFSSNWQLVINTGTTIVTFLMVFLIQNAQNRDEAAVQLKLDELLKAVTGARTGFIDLEDLSVEQIEALRQQFRELAEKHSEDVTLVTARIRTQEEEEEEHERREEEERRRHEQEEKKLEKEERALAKEQKELAKEEKERERRSADPSA